jgi:hypothetical protein
MKVQGQSFQFRYAPPVNSDQSLDHVATVRQRFGNNSAFRNSECAICQNLACPPSCATLDGNEIFSWPQVLHDPAARFANLGFKDIPKDAKLGVIAAQSQQEITLRAH